MTVLRTFTCLGSVLLGSLLHDETLINILESDLKHLLNLMDAPDHL